LVAGGDSTAGPIGSGGGNGAPTTHDDMNTQLNSLSSSSSSPSSSSSAPPAAGKGGCKTAHDPKPGGSPTPRRVGKPTYKGQDGEIYVDDDGNRYKCSLYRRGDNVTSRWYQIDASGARILGHSFRPPSIGPGQWVKMSEMQKLEEIAKHSDAQSTSSAPRVAGCAPLGLLGLLGLDSAVAAHVVEWSNHDHKLEEPTSLDDYCTKASDLQPELAPEDQRLPWDAWDDFVAELEAPQKARLGAQVVAGGASAAGPTRAPSNVGGASTASSRRVGRRWGKRSVDGGDSAAGTNVTSAANRVVVAPVMPTVAYDPKHRPKLRRRVPFNACVARPVSRREQRANPKARDAMRDEWERLRKMGTWDDTTVEEWSDVAKKARAANEEVHFGYLLGSCFEKGSELPDNHPDRKFKGRSVFQGDRVVNQNYEVALFQDLGSSPATLEAARACDAFGCAPGNATQVADAPAAYVQADLKGTPCWVHLPEDAWPDDPVLRAKFAGLRKPVVPLRKALYGHPDSGTFWEQHCDNHVRSVGFEPLGSEWPSC